MKCRLLIKYKVIVICLVALLILGGMYYPSKVVASENSRTRLTLYFVFNAPREFYLVPVSVLAPKDSEPIRQALELLIQGPPAGSALMGLIPKETRLLDCRLENGMVYIDFSEEIRFANVGSRGEALILQSIMGTLSQFPEVKKVQILVDSKKAESLAGHVDISDPLNMGDGYNISLYEGFEDSTQHWAEGNITALCLTGVVDGFPDGKFYPDSTLTRAEFVKMLVAAGDDRPVQPNRGTFPDVPSDHWASAYVERAVESGILIPSDYGSSVLRQFKPNVPVSRREVAVMLARAKGLEQMATESRGAILPFTDIGQEEPEWAKGYISVILEQGIMGGYPDNTFRPSSYLTRAEAATVIGRYMGILNTVNLSLGKQQNIIITFPQSGFETKSGVLVMGVARTFEATVSLRAKASDSVVHQMFMTATEGGPGWGVFAAIVPQIQVTERSQVSIECFWNSPKDGSELDLVCRGYTQLPE